MHKSAIMDMADHPLHRLVNHPGMSLMVYNVARLKVQAENRAHGRMQATVQLRKRPSTTLSEHIIGFPGYRTYHTDNFQAPSCNTQAKWYTPHQTCGDFMHQLPDFVAPISNPRWCPASSGRACRLVVLF